MAKFLDKDPYSYDKERQAFVNELRQFHMRIGTPLLRLPSIAGKELDLYLLYKKVIALGGLAKITDDEQWEGILLAFKIPPSCCHAAFALRSFYVKYLEAYEKIHHQGEDAAEVMAAHRPSVPTGQMQGSSRIPDKLRSSVGLSTAKANITDYDKIIHSLQCGLPNEVDFAINVCTLLSNEGKHVIHLERAPQLIDLLLAHVGVFFEGPGSIRMLYEEDWLPTTNRNFVKYWYDTVRDNEVREVIGPEPFKPKGDMDYKEGELFCGRSQGLTAVEEQRITQISIILRNLSFEKHNRRVMAAHRTLYRFLLLCVHNSDSALKQLGIDTLSNLAADFILDPIDYRSTQLMFHTIDKGMKDPDRLVVLRAMEVLQKLSKVRANLETIKLCLEARVYHAIIQMLIVHDVQLLLGALEVLLALSQTGEIICTRIAKVEKSIDILVCLVTLDAQSLGAEAFVGIKIVDHAPNGIHHPIVTMARYQGRKATNTPPPSKGTSVARSGSAHASDRGATPPPQQQKDNASSSASRAAESESFASQWLRSRYESKPQGSVSRIDLYADYLSACSKMTRGCILNSNSFAACIRNLFPGVGFQRIEQENGAQYHITGIQRRAIALPLRWKKQSQLGAPQVNYHMQVGNNQNTASNIIAHLARRHSPSGKSTPSPPPPRGNYPLQSMTNSATAAAPPQAPTQLTAVQVQGVSTQQYPQKPASSMIPNPAQPVPTGRPLPPAPLQNPGATPQYPGGHILPTNPNQLPQTVLQRPPPSHAQISLAASLTSPRSRSKSPKPSGAVSNPVTPSPPPPPSQPPQPVLQPDTNPAPAPAPALSTNTPPPPPENDVTDGSQKNSPATVIIGGLLPTEKCQPPSKAPLPEGEVRIEKVPNLHAQLLQQAQKKAQQQGTHPAIPLPLQVQQQQGVEVPAAAPSPDNGLALNTLPNPLGLQQQMQQAMQAATAISTQTLTLPNGGQQPITTMAPVASQPNHSTPSPGTTQYVPIQPKPNSNSPVPSAKSPQQLPSNQNAQQAVKVGIPQQNQMQVLLINRPAQPGSVQPQQAGVPQQGGQYGQVRAYTQPAALPNQFPRLAGQIPRHNTSSPSTDSPLIKRLLQSGTSVQPPVRVSPPIRVSPPQQQMVQPNPQVPVPNNSQWAGPNQTMPQVLPSQGFNHAVPVQTTQQHQQPQIQQQNVVGYVNNATNVVPQANVHVQNTVLHRPSPPPLPTVNEQLQQHRENQRHLQLQQQQVATQNIQTQSPQPNTNLNNGKSEDLNTDTSKKANGPTSTSVLIPQDSTNGSKADEIIEESSNELPKCNGTSQEHESLSKSIEEKMEVDSIVKPSTKPVDSLLKQRLVNGYASDSEMPVRNDIVTVNRVEEVEKTSGILEAALSIAGIEPDSDERTSSGKSTPTDQLLASAKSSVSLNHVLNGEILCDRSKGIPPPVGDSNLNQGNKTVAVIIGNNGMAQDTNIPKPNATSAKQVNQLILCRDIRENLPPNLHILPSNYNNNNQQQPQQQQAGTVVAAAAAPQVSTNTSSGSVQLVAQPIAATAAQQQPQQQQQQVVKQQQQVQIQNTAVSRNNTVQVQGAIITVQQPQTQKPVHMSTTQVQQGQPVTLQLQQQQQQPANVQTVSVQQPTAVRQLVVTTQHPQQQQQLAVNMQQQTLIVRPVQPGTTQSQTMNIQVQNPNGQTQQQVIRVPVSIQGGHQQILSVQRPLQAGQQQTQQSMIIVNVNTNQNASSMPAPSSVATIKSSGSLKRPAPADSPKSKDSKVNNTVEGSSPSSSSHHKEKKKKHHSSSKKRRKSASSSSSSHHQCSKKQQAEQPKTSAVLCICEWKGCRRSFSTPKTLHIHASKMHVMGASYRLMCEWEGCDHIQRQRWSCVSHILDKHCTQQAIKAANDRRAKQALNSSSNDVVSGPTQPPIVYNAHNAYHAIRRSLCTPSLKDLLGETEGPVTKSIRLTASLVLKNLATRSAEARRLIRRHEAHLARLVISQAEASTTLSKCILELNTKT